MSDFASLVRSYQAGDLQSVRRNGRMFLRREPAHRDALLLLSLVHVALGEYAEAEPLLKRLLAYQPQHAGANYLLGNTLRERKDLDGAAQRYERALSIAPDVIEAWINLGLCRFDQGRLADALNCFEQALQLQPDQPLALYNAGNTLQSLGRHAEAILRYQHALQHQPEDWRIHYNLGNALLIEGRPGEALACFDAVLERNTVLMDAHANAGVALRRLGHPGEAVKRLHLALALSADNAPALLSLANAQSDLGRYAEAATTLTALLGANPDDIEARYSLALALQEVKDFPASTEQFAAVLAKDPDNHRYLTGAISAAWSCWDMSGVAELWPRLEGSWQGAASAPVELWSRMLDDPARISESALRTMRHLVAEQSFSLEPQTSAPVRIIAGEPIQRLVYLSPDFGEHPVGYSVVELLERHDRRRYSVTAIALGRRPPSAIGDRLVAACDEYIDAAALSTPDVARLIRDRHTDVAIDLAGYTAGGRPMILSARPAAVQIGYLGFPSTSGAHWLDYLLVDSVVAPAVDASLYAEQLVWLPHSFFPSDSRATNVPANVSRAEENLPEAAIVYACFNTPERITNEMFTLWMRILQTQPGSVLWLRNSLTHGVERMRAKAAELGVSPDRLVFAGFSPDRAHHLARHKLADLYLDTFPYNSHSTARDAIQAGLPLLTLTGRTFASRVAASLLHTLALPELITANPQDYVDVALTLAREPARLALLKGRLQQAIVTSPLFDTAGLARHIESAYEHMLARHRSGLPPQAFAVPASPQDT